MTWVRIFWFLVCLVWVGAEIGLARRQRAADGEIACDERHSQGRLWLFITLGLVLALLCKQLALLPIPLAYLPRQILALAIFAGGLYLRYTAVIGLGRFFTTHVAILNGHRLIEDGPYRLLRHPAYTGLLMALAAAGLAMGDGLALLSLMLCSGWALAHRIEIEERMLEQQFGDCYRDYRNRRWRLLPWFY
ncbi:methyltransferase family protein [Methylomonas sp. HW2-6]|uniref:methyltransferase family protein n=1 Tax=Methylomonas sp. HW2-6 TaxID=3376687 RepID=UPI0040411D96